MPATKMITCPKCGAKSSIRHLRKRKMYSCESCEEPLRQLIELDQAKWEVWQYDITSWTMGSGQRGTKYVRKTNPMKEERQDGSS